MDHTSYCKFDKNPIVISRNINNPIVTISSILFI